MTVECIKAARYLKKHNVSAEVIDLEALGRWMQRLLQSQYEKREI